MSIKPQDECIWKSLGVAYALLFLTISITVNWQTAVVVAAMIICMLFTFDKLFEVLE